MSAVLVGVFFLAMGLVALAVPERVSATFGTPTLTAEGRNEVRAVYGGFGVALGVLLLVAPRLPAIRQGVLVCAAVALAGMAAGRVLALAVERPRRFYPCGFYLTVEALMAAVLFAAA